MRTKYLFYIGGIILGAIGGYIYWHEIGCLNGSCMIGSTWYRMVPYGSVMGFLFAGVVHDLYQKWKVPTDDSSESHSDPEVD